LALIEKLRVSKAKTSFCAVLRKKEGRESLQRRRGAVMIFYLPDANSGGSQINVKGGEAARGTRYIF
jgi:hypothetical protein